MNRLVFVFVLTLPTAAFGQVVGEVDGDHYVGGIIVLSAVVELPALDPPAPWRSVRYRPRPRLLTSMLVAHTWLQLANAHSTLRPGGWRPQGFESASVAFVGCQPFGLCCRLVRSCHVGYL